MGFLDNIGKGFIIKFFVIWIPLTLLFIWFAPSLKYKLLFPICGAVGIFLALTGKSAKGMTPLGRRF